MHRMTSAPPALAGGSPPPASLYTVSQLGDLLGVSARTIRFYEDKGLITPRRAGSTRVYSERDRARMALILRAKRIGYSLVEIKTYLGLYDATPRQPAEALILRANIATRTAQLRAQRDAIDASLHDLGELDRRCDALLSTNHA